eukprot:scaffold2987_cov170-Amphora_coffeaeformis.AAC.19
MGSKESTVQSVGICAVVQSVSVISRKRVALLLTMIHSFTCHGQSQTSIPYTTLCTLTLASSQSATKASST